MRTLLLLLFLATNFCINSSFATNFHAASNGDWTNPATWGEATLFPSVGDSVFIDGYDVTSDNSNITVQYIAISNTADRGNTILTVSGTTTLTVTGGVDIISDDFSRDLFLEVLLNATLDIGASLTVSRTSTDSADKEILILVDNSGQLKVGVDFIFDYDNAGFMKGDTNIDILDMANLTVLGNLTIDLQGGDNFHFDSKSQSTMVFGSNIVMEKHGGRKAFLHIDSNNPTTVGGNVVLTHTGGEEALDFQVGNNQGTVDISGNLSMTSNTADLITTTTVNGASTRLLVGGNIILDAQSEGDVSVNTEANSELMLGGSFSRTDFGSLNMDIGTSLTYNGSGSQTIAATDVPGSGSDQFTFADVYIENTSGLALILEDTLFIDKSIALTQGIIKSDTLRPVIILDQAMIMGGGANAYIEGPVIKRGRSTGVFTFPLGAQNVYAPLQLSEITSPGSVYEAQYLNCPPPIGGLGLGVAHVSNQEFWQFEWNTGSDLVDFTLNWSDTNASGIDDLDSLLVVYKSGTNDWESMGNIGTGFGPDDSGWIIGDGINCPPPIGSFSLTFGSKSPGFNTGLLPVELIRFSALPIQNQVALSWETATEIEFSHYEIERSVNAVDFEPLGEIPGKGNERQRQQYWFKDLRPLNGTNYYRLKMVDIDGRYTYSALRSVAFNFGRKLQAYPNPIANQITIQTQVERTHKPSLVEVYNSNGTLLYQQQRSFEYGELKVSSEELNMEAAGSYYLQVTDEYGTRNLPLLKF